MTFICVVDDSPVVTRQVKRLLQAGGMGDAALFNDPRSALQWCLLNSPAVILLDYSMPHMDGLEMLRRLKRHPRTARCVVAMMTAWETATLRRRAMEAGAAAMIAKPFGGREFEDFVLALKNAYRGPPTQQSQKPVASSDGLEASGADQSTIALSRLLHDFAIIRPPPICEDRPLLRSLAGATAKHCGVPGLAMGQLDAALHRCLRLRLATLDPSRQAAPDLCDSGSHDADATLRDLGLQALELMRFREEDALTACVEMVVFGQEQWDGAGGPLGKRGVSIPLPARLFRAVNDLALWLAPSLSAGEPAPFEQLLDQLEAGAGHVYDPAVVKALCAVARDVVAAYVPGPAISGWSALWPHSPGVQPS